MDINLSCSAQLAEIRNIRVYSVLIAKVIKNPLKPLIEFGNIDAIQKSRFIRLPTLQPENVFSGGVENTL